MLGFAILQGKTYVILITFAILVRMRHEEMSNVRQSDNHGISTRSAYCIEHCRALNVVYVLSDTWCDQRIKFIRSSFYLTSLPIYKTTFTTRTFPMGSFEVHCSRLER